MNLSNFVKGIQILRPYYDDDSYSRMGAEHDQFYMYATDHELSEADLDTMRELGWFQSEVDGDEYDPSDGWSCYV